MTEITFVGDIMLGRKVKATEQLFQNVKEFLKSDIKFGNLESPLCHGLKYIHDKKFTFSAQEDSIKLLKDFHILSIANNHIIDCNKEGIQKTKDTLKKNNIQHIGFSKEPLIINKNNQKIGFLAYCKPNKFFNIIQSPNIINQNITTEIKQAKSKCDILVVFLHWGKEYEKEPSKKQIDLAHNIIDNGADIIIGNHAHVPQKIETYKGKIIAYCLGNFVFDQFFNEDVRKSIILKINTDTMQYKTLNTYMNKNFTIDIK